MGPQGPGWLRSRTGSPVPTLDTCVIWPRTLHSDDSGVPHPASTSPRPGRSSSPLTFPLSQFSFLRQRQGMPLRKRGEEAKAPRAHSTSPAPEKKPLPSSCQQPWRDGNARGPGQKEANQEEAAGGGGDAPRSQSHQPLGPPQWTPNLGTQQLGSQGEMAVPTPPQVWQGEGEGAKEGLVSGS